MCELKRRSLGIAILLIIAVSQWLACGFAVCIRWSYHARSESFSSCGHDRYAGSKSLKVDDVEVHRKRLSIESGTGFR
jgi:hypothetical protein